VVQFPNCYSYFWRFFCALCSKQKLTKIKNNRDETEIFEIVFVVKCRAYLEIFILIFWCKFYRPQIKKFKSHKILKKPKIIFIYKTDPIKNLNILSKCLKNKTSFTNHLRFVPHDKKFIFIIIFRPRSHDKSMFKGRRGKTKGRARERERKTTRLH
jgi:hypothetical protein